jgi:hypothetical protein
MNRHERRRQAKNDREIERHRAEVRFALQELVAAGHVVATGEMRPGVRTGVLQPVYVLREVAAKMGLPLPPLKPLLHEDLTGRKQ